MTDNLLLVQQLVRSYGRSTVTPRCMLMADIHKDFDTVSWSFLENILKGFGFPNSFTSLIMECVTTASYSISLNGNLHGFFNGKRGIRQGDPLSPYLFVLAMEYLSRMIKISTANPDFNHHPKCSKLDITHLAFADDLMIFTRGDAESVRIISNTLHQFGKISGLQINPSKSKIFAAGISNDLYVELQNISNFPPGEFLVRYLGLPLIHGKIKCSHFAPPVEGISKRINEWTTSSLSYAGKLELIVAVVQGMETFWLDTSPMPSSIIDRLDKLCRNLLSAGG